MGLTKTNGRVSSVTKITKQMFCRDRRESLNHRKGRQKQNISLSAEVWDGSNRARVFPIWAHMFSLQFCLCAWKLKRSRLSPVAAPDQVTARAASSHNHSSRCVLKQLWDRLKTFRNVSRHMACVLLRAEVFCVLLFCFGESTRGSWGPTQFHPTPENMAKYSHDLISTWQRSQLK